MIKVNEGCEQIYADIRQKFQAENCTSSNSGSTKYTNVSTSATSPVPGNSATNYNSAIKNSFVLNKT